MKSILNIAKFVILTLVLFPLTTSVFGQNQQRTFTNVQDARKAVLESFENRDFHFIDISECINNVYVLSPMEQEILSLIQGKYSHFFKIIKYHNTITYSINGVRYLTEDEDELENMKFKYAGRYEKKILKLLQDELVNSGSRIKSDLRSRSFTEAQLEFVSFYIDNIDFIRNQFSNNELQLDLHFRSQNLVEKYNISEFNVIARQLHGQFFEPSWFGIDLSTTSGFGYNTGNFGDFFRRRASFTVEVKVYWYANFIGLRWGFYGNRLLDTDYNFDSEFLNNITHLGVSHTDLYLGRKFDITKRFSLVPSFGISVIGGGFYYKTDLPEVVDGPSLVPSAGDDIFISRPFVGLDVNYHFKNRNLQRTLTKRFNKRLGYSSGYFILGVAYTHGPIHEYESVLTGNTFSFQFGVGMHFRFMKRSVLSNW